MADPAVEQLRGLVLSAVELRQMTDWPEALIEDYLTLLENLIILAENIDIKNNIIKNTTLVTVAVYAILATDEEIFFNTDANPITATLPEGVDGTNYRMINVGVNKNNVTVIPFGTEDLFGENASEKIIDSEVLLMTFQTGEGWY